MQHENIGKRIKQRRQELDISAAELADRLHLSRGTVHRYESGEIKNIKIPVITSIAGELKVNPGWLLGKSGRKEQLEYKTEDERYTEVTKTLDDITAFLGYREDITCNGIRMDEKDKEALIIGLEMLRKMITKRYE